MPALCESSPIMNLVSQGNPYYNPSSSRFLSKLSSAKFHKVMVLSMMRTQSIYLSLAWQGTGRV